MLNIFIYMVILLLAIIRICRAFVSSAGRETAFKQQWIERVHLLIPFLALIPFISEIFSYQEKYRVAFVYAATDVLNDAGEGRVFMMLITLYILSLLLKYRLNDQRNAKVLLPMVEGISTLVILQLSNEIMEYIGWSGFLLSALYVVSLSILTGLTYSLAKCDDTVYSTKKRIYIIGGSSLGVFIISTIGLLILTVPQYVRSWMVDYGLIIFAMHLLSVIFILFSVRHFLFIRSGKLYNVKKNSTLSLYIQSWIGGILILQTGILMVLRPPQDVLRTLEDTAINPIVQFLVGDQLSAYQVIKYDVGPSIFLVIYLGAMLLLVSVVLTLFTRYIIMSLIASILFISIVFGGSLAAIAPGDILVDDTVFPNVKSAIAASYENGQEFDILYESRKNNEVYLVYGINGVDLGVEKLEVTDGGYKRTPLSGLVLEGALWREQSMALTTRKLEEGYWLEDHKKYVYLSFGYLGQNKEAKEVNIEFKGKTKTIPVNDKYVFFDVESTNQNFPEFHQVKLLNDSNQELATYKYNSMTGSFHH
ncbi:hypothetical protein ACVA6F_12190 [Bacillus altitudinis]|uniref:hypothetical protein n=1 Tax=Bacillus altitudinis TaxID=293387 RepID=UPI001C3861D5|nr:hypothetical protein [Bacillus altitudinis]MBV5112948.1 hypothetical protein [Bacillus altitudinis]MBW2729422.1 hypothetical protein [Bacillus altitudinis]